jgi:methylated-DNA-[protein]-cysteine S-methyltransferase
MAVAYRGDVITAVSFGHGAADGAVRGLKQTPLADAKTEPAPAETGPVADVIARLTSYAAGDIVDFSDLRLDLDGLTPFQRRVIRACRRIPRGRTMTYAQLAARVKSPGAARAVGSVMAKNRFPIIVPCHRVVASDGSLGGYSAPSGLRMKRRLLRMEGVSCAK